MPPINPNWILAGGQFLQTLLGVGGQERANQQNMDLAAAQAGWNRENQRNQNQFNLEMWDRQKAHNIDMWQRANEYNSPTAQLARMKNAGLNPALMYGQGSPGNAPPVANAQAPAAANVQGYSRAEAKNVLAGVETFSNIAQMKNIAAQTNNLDKLGRLYESEKLRKDADTIRIAADTALKGIQSRKTGFDLRLGERLWENTIEAAELNVKNLTANYDYKQQEISLFGLRREEIMAKVAKTNVERAQIEKLSDSQIALINQRVAQIRQDIEGKKTAMSKTALEVKMLEFANQMRQKGIEMSDSAWWRWIFGGDNTIESGEYRHR